LRIIDIASSSSGWSAQKVDSIVLGAFDIAPSKMAIFTLNGNFGRLSWYTRHQEEFDLGWYGGGGCGFVRNLAQESQSRAASAIMPVVSSPSNYQQLPRVSLLGNASVWFAVRSSLD
jgi:hypothetical protein